jgi:Na+-translocating ferredoxin:NAD+ oxidoreductase RnfC subunit
MESELKALLETCDGKTCTCAAYGQCECACDADWTPAEVYELRDAIATQSARVAAFERQFAENELQREHLIERAEAAEAELAKERELFAIAAADMRRKDALIEAAEAERDGLRGLLGEMRGDYSEALGITEAAYNEFCRMGALGRMPSDTWPRHCAKRREQIDAAMGRE